jgi:predicted aspartyl protease
VILKTLMRTGTLTAADFQEEATYRLADGSTVPSPTFRIRSLKVGDKVFENVTASVASAKSDLLVGQSFLSRLKSWPIDNSRQVLILE